MAALAAGVIFTTQAERISCYIILYTVDKPVHKETPIKIIYSNMFVET